VSAVLTHEYPVTAPVPRGDEVGPMVTGADIEDAVQGQLKTWLPRYIVAGELQHGLTVGSTPAPKGWAISGRVMDKLLSDQLPCVIVQAGGVAPAGTHREGTGALTGTWTLAVAVMFDAAWGRESRRRAQLYARAAQLALQQLPLHALGAPCKVDWRGESYDEVDFATTRTYSASVVNFTVWCREIASTDGGPPPEALPPGSTGPGDPGTPTVPFVPWVEVSSTEVTVEPHPLEGSKEP
jgi:hypothetical protein